MRRFIPCLLYWGSSKWHPEPQWLLDGFDEDRKAMRTFALRDMKPQELDANV